MADTEVYELLEAEGYKYTIRLPANSVLQERISWLLKRPVGRPPHEVRRIVHHGRSITFQLAEVMVSRDLFREILAAIAALRPRPPARC